MSIYDLTPVLSMLPSEIYLYYHFISLYLIPFSPVDSILVYLTVF